MQSEQIDLSIECLKCLCDSRLLDPARKRDFYPKQVARVHPTRFSAAVGKTKQVLVETLTYDEVAKPIGVN